MTAAAQFEPLWDWVRGDTRAVRADATGFSIAGDEVTLTIRREADEWTVRKTWRDQDRGIVFATTAAEDVDRYLTLNYANEMRAARGLRPLRHGIDLNADGTASPSGGFTLTGDLDRGFTLTEAGTGKSWLFDSDIEAARYSRYAAIPAAELRESIGRVERDLLKA